MAARSFRPLVLCYHAISDSWEHALAVPLRALERHVQGVLWRGYRPATAADVLLRGGRRVHVTFDDAYRSIEPALALLERRGVPATVFTCSGFADTGRPLDVPELAAEAESYPHELATMDWDALRRLADAGVEIGSHTMRHPHLPQLSSQELDRELRESRVRIESELGRACSLLAYPYGEYDERVRDAARRAGYAGAFALAAPRAPFDPFALPRVGLYRRDSLARALLKTSFVRHPAASISGALRSRTAPQTRGRGDAK